MMNETKRIESKTIAIKQVNLIKNGNNNSKKRRHSNDMNESQQTKKRKLNENNKKTMEQRFRELFAKNLSLSQELRRCKRERDENKQNMNHYKQQTDHYKQEMNECEHERNHYQQKMNYYKDKYINLKNTLIMAINEDQNDDTENEDNDINYNENGQEYQPIYDDDNDDDDENENNYNWEHCHYISVNCKFCGKHYDNLKEYSDHLMNEFNNDATKTWLKCDESQCKYKNKTFSCSQTFIIHLCSHGHQQPFHCKMKTLDGNICKHSSSSKGAMIKHLTASIHRIKVKSYKNTKIKNRNNSNYNWKDCHYIEINCKFCGKHYNDYNKYINHLKYHFDNDPSKTWLMCNESGCNVYKNKKCTSGGSFVAHLCSHGHQQPFHCKMKNIFTGKMCTHSSSTKCSMIKHLSSPSIHQITFKKRIYKKRKKKKEINEDSYSC